MLTIYPISDGLHTWGVQSIDAAGNVSPWVNGSFSTISYRRWFPFFGSESGSDSGGCVDAITNGGFERDEGWAMHAPATYHTQQVHSGSGSARVGIPAGEPGVNTYSSVAQTVALPAGGTAVLTVWAYHVSEANDPGDWHYIGLRDQSSVYHALDQLQSAQQVWEQRQYDVSSFLGQAVTLYFGTRNDGDDDTAHMIVDDVVLEVCP